MRKKFPLPAILAIAAVLTVLAACNQKAARSDAQVASDVQTRIYSDGAIQSRSIGVQAANGVVTLSGNVNSDVERGAAANDAAAVEGVRTVVNNLQTQQAQVAPPAAAPVAEQSAPVPVQEKRESKRSKPSAAIHSRPTSTHTADNDEPVLARNNSPAASPAMQQQVQQNTPPPPPPPPKKVTIPAGTQVTVRLSDPLDSERNQVGDTFHGSLGSPIVIDDQTVIPEGADVTGRVADVKSAGRFAGNSALTLELTNLSVNGRSYNIQTNQWSRAGKGEGKNTAVKAGGGAAIGALIGGLAGGGKGAAIGAAAGGATGTGVAASKKGEQIKLGPEATLNFQLINTLTVTPQGTNDRNAGRTPLEQ
jgi:hypothetical protein